MRSFTTTTDIEALDLRYSHLTDADVEEILDVARETLARIPAFRRQVFLQRVEDLEGVLALRTWRREVFAAGGEIDLREPVFG